MARKSIDPEFDRISEEEEGNNPAFEHDTNPEKPKKSGNGSDNEIVGMLQKLIKQNRDINDRMDDLEKSGHNTNAEAQLRLINLVYDTDDKHLPELTRIPIQAARPHALAMGLESLLEDDGTIPLSRVIRNYYFRLNRSVGGVQLMRGSRLAEQQAEAESEEPEDREFGGG